MTNRFVMIGLSLVPGLVRPVPVVVSCVGPQRALPDPCPAIRDQAVREAAEIVRAAYREVAGGCKPLICVACGLLAGRLVVEAGPLPCWGWGDIPDQYGRRRDGDDGSSPMPKAPTGWPTSRQSCPGGKPGEPGA